MSCRHVEAAVPIDDTPEIRTGVVDVVGLGDVVEGFVPVPPVDLAKPREGRTPPPLEKQSASRGADLVDDVPPTALKEEINQPIGLELTCTLRLSWSCGYQITDYDNLGYVRMLCCYFKAPNGGVWGLGGVALGRRACG